MNIGRLTAGAILFMLASPPVASEELVSVHLGETTFEVPDTWIDPAWRATMQIGQWGDIVLRIPLDALPQAESDIRLAGVVNVSMLLSDNDSATEEQAIWKSKVDAGLLGFASNAQAKLAFEDIEFDNLYVGFSASGKSRIPALFLIGTTSIRNSSILVSARIDTGAEPSTDRRYVLTFATVTERQSIVSIRIALDTTRPLASTDFHWLEYVSDLLNNRVFD